MSDRVAIMLTDVLSGRTNKTEILDRTYTKAGLTTSLDMTKVPSHFLAR